MPPTSSPHNPRMQRKGRNIVDIPTELLIVIVDALNDKEQRELMCVSQYFFQVVGPGIWKTVPRVELLLRLIEGTQFSVTRIPVGYGPSIGVHEMTFPSDPDLTRLNIYTPWVQELEIYGAYFQKIMNPDLFIATLDGRPPLENLRRLTAIISYPKIANERNEPMNLFTMFISPSLIEIRTFTPPTGFYLGPRPFVHSHVVRGFLEKIKNTCPKIQKLEFYPEIIGIYEWLDDPCRSILSSLVNLCSFSCTTQILDPKLLGMLGQLPHLESLGILGSSEGPSVLDGDLSIPETWFLALKDLRLHRVHHEDIRILWNQPTIVKNLVSATIQADALPYSKNWVGPFFQACLPLTPHLNLSFYLNGGYGDRRIRPEYWTWFEENDGLSPVFYSYLRARRRRKRLRAA
ncbi:unnamed protein product [Rhizoctonia solani]|uniref:F-box domain-containing protein n=1 Tax=Rhizoctonia solani TaxID=456999 RepID=A0A8H3B0K4_9AGAM|nr:unnamed protein product [Rhizoctonia solani]